MNEVGEVWGGEVVNGLEGMEEDLIVNAVFNGEPVELMENWGDVMDDRGFGDDASRCVLDQL